MAFEHSPLRFEKTPSNLAWSSRACHTSSISILLMSETSGSLDSNPTPGDPPIINAPFRFWSGLSEDLREGWSQRELLRSLIARELRQRYKGAFLGWGWALIRPLVMLAIYALAVGLFLGMGAAIPEFAIYLYVGLIAWGYFATVVSGSIAALPANSGLINKASFRRELLIVAVVVVGIVDLLLQASVLLIGYLFYGSWPNVFALWWVIPGFAVLTIVGVGLGLLLSAVNVYFRDVGYLIEVALQVGFWLVPILYAYSMVQSALASQPGLLALYSANPALSAISAFRFALWPSASSEVGQAQLLSMSPTTTYLVAWILVGLILVWLGQRLFSRMAGNIAQEL